MTGGQWQRCTGTSRPFAQDRAHVVAVAVVQIVRTCPRDPVRAVAAYLRDEFSDLERQVTNDLKVDN
jgi:hypothetical protein